MANDGYIKMYRRMMKWGWYTDTPTKCVFLHLLFLACYEPCYYKGVQLEPGQAVSSIRQIATDTGLTVKQVRTAINHLKETQEVTQSPCGKFSVFTVNNYNDYQCTGTDEGKQRAQRGHSEGTDPNIKKNKEVKNTPHTPQGADADSPAFTKFWASYPKKVGKADARKKFAALVQDDATLSAILSSLAYLKTTPQWTKDNGQYIPNPATWLNQKRWQDEASQPQKPTAPEKPRRPIFDREYTREERINGVVPKIIGWEDVE